MSIVKRLSVAYRLFLQLNLISKGKLRVGGNTETLVSQNIKNHAFISPDIGSKGLNWRCLSSAKPLIVGRVQGICKEVEHHLKENKFIKGEQTLI